MHSSSMVGVPARLLSPICSLVATVPGDEPVEGDSQLSNASLMTLERNSFNFLE